MDQFTSVSTETHNLLRTALRPLCLCSVVWLQCDDHRGVPGRDRGAVRAATADVAVRHAGYRGLRAAGGRERVGGARRHHRPPFQKLTFPKVLTTTDLMVLYP